MKRFLKWFLGTIAVIIVLFLLILIIGIIGASKGGYMTEQNNVAEDPALISIAKYGEAYPFTIDNLRLKCEDGAVWVEDEALNKYALNGLANGKFQGRGDYKGYTTSIEKPNPDIPNTTLGDGGMLSKGMEFCK